jgi:hypothetical protein
MDYVGLLTPLLLMILCVQLGILANKLDAMINLMKTRE